MRLWNGSGCCLEQVTPDRLSRGPPRTGCPGASRGAPLGQMSRGPPGTIPGQLSRGAPGTPRDAPRTLSPGTPKFEILGAWSVLFFCVFAGVLYGFPKPTQQPKTAYWPRTRVFWVFSALVAAPRLYDSIAMLRRISKMRSRISCPRLPSCHFAPHGPFFRYLFWSFLCRFFAFLKVGTQSPYKTSCG